MPTIANQPITTGSIRIFEQGDWFADVATNSSERIPNGTRVDIVAGTLTLSGAIVRGDITESVGRYQVAGRPEWAKSLLSRPSNAERSANAVLLKTVLSKILLETLGANWQSLVVMPPAASLARHYERPGTNADTTILARDLLALLKLSWHVRNDGITVFDVRPTGTVTTESRVLIDYRNDAIGYRVVNCEDPGAFMPGLVFEGETIGETTFAISSDDITMHLWSRGAANAESNWFARTWRRLFPRAELQGLYEYVVAGPSGDWNHNLRSIGSRRLPDIDTASFWTGAAGHRATFPTGARVGVSFLDSDPSKPVLVCTEPTFDRNSGGNPILSELYATDTISIDCGNYVELAGAVGFPVRYGDTVSIAGASPAAGIIAFTPGAPPFQFPSRVKV